MRKRLTCNIDRRGRWARGISGGLCVLAGILVVVLVAPEARTWGRWLLAVILVALGGFQFFEAYTGWCVTRALGFKTPM